MANIRKHVAKDGSISYRVQVRYRGINRYETFPTRKDAQDWAVKTESEILNKKFFPERQKRQPCIVGQLIDRYREEVLPLLATNTQLAYDGILKYWYRVLGDKPLENITRETINKCKFYLWHDKQYSPYYVNLHLAVIRGLFSTALEWNLVEYNPCTGVKKMQVDENLPDISDEKLSLLLRTAKESSSPYLYPFVILALSTGGRTQEILALKWSQVDLKRKVIIFAKTKSKKDRTIPLNELAIEALAMLENGAEYVFYNPRTRDKLRRIKDSFYPLRKQLGLLNLRVHDFRHIFATRLATHAKADIGTIAHLLGHAHIQQSRRYIHLTEQHTSDVVNRMSAEVFKNLV